MKMLKINKKILFFTIIIILVALSSTMLVSHSYYLTETEDDLFTGSFDILGNVDIILTVYKEDNSGSGTKYYVNEDNQGRWYSRVTSLPNNVYQNYKYEYSCARGNANITYDVSSKKLVIDTDGKDICRIFFYENKGDVFLNVYVNGELTTGAQSGHTLSSSSYCTDVLGNNLSSSEYSIDYNKSTGIVTLDSARMCKCYVYLT